MKKWILVTAAVMLATGLILGGAWAALAQGNTPPAPPFSGPGGWMGGRGMMGFGQTYSGTAPFGYGMMGAWGGSMHGVMMASDGVHEQVWTAVAQELGLTYDQLQAELGAKTLAQLAQEKGVALDKLQEAAQTAWEAAINQLVEEGKLTREQADWMIQRMDEAGFPMLGLGQGYGPCHDDDLPFRGGPGRGPMSFGGRQS